MSTFGGDQFPDPQAAQSSDGHPSRSEPTAVPSSEPPNSASGSGSGSSCGKNPVSPVSPIGSLLSPIASLISVASTSAGSTLSLIARQKATFFSFFYFVINAGSLLSMSMTPILKEAVHCYGKDTCYPLAFGIPAVLMAVALLVFVLGAGFYRDKNKKAERYVLAQIGSVVLFAFRHRKGKSVDVDVEQVADKDPVVVGKDPAVSEVDDGTPVLVLNDAPARHFSDSAVIDMPPSATTVKKGGSSFLDCARLEYGDALVDDILGVLRVIRLFLPVIFFWSLYDQQSSRWVYQGYMMNPMVGQVKILSEQMQLINSVLVLTFIPLFNYGVYPMVARFAKVTPLRKVVTGMAIASATFVLSAWLQLRINAGTLIQVRKYSIFALFDSSFHCIYFYLFFRATMG